MGELGILDHPQWDYPLGTPGFHGENPSDIFKNEQHWRDEQIKDFPYDFPAMFDW